jgi:hypothetical protein
MMKKKPERVTPHFLLENQYFVFFLSKLLQKGRVV